MDVSAVTIGVFLKSIEALVLRGRAAAGILPVCLELLLQLVDEGVLGGRRRDLVGGTGTEDIPDPPTDTSATDERDENWDQPVRHYSLLSPKVVRVASSTPAIATSSFAMSSSIAESTSSLNFASDMTAPPLPVGTGLVLSGSK